MKIKGINDNLDNLQKATAKYNEVLQYFVKQKEDAQKRYNAEYFLDWKRAQLSELRGHAAEARKAIEAEMKAVSTLIDELQAIKPGRVDQGTWKLVEQTAIELTAADIEANMTDQLSFAEERLLLMYAEKHGIELENKPISGDELKAIFDRIAEYCRHVVMLDPDTPKAAAAERCQHLVDRFDEMFKTELEALRK